MDKIMYDELIEGFKVRLFQSGIFQIAKYQDWNRQGENAYKNKDWYHNTTTGKSWIPKKRRNFISLIKQSIREREWDE